MEYVRESTTERVGFMVKKVAMPLVCWSHDCLLSREVNEVFILTSNLIIWAIAYASCSK